MAVVGAGAAGLMAAIRAAAGGASSVRLYDTRPKIGAKILMSGGTRCNVTNERVSASDYHGGAPHFVRHVLEAHDETETVEFFGRIGVELVLEPGGKYFPVTHSGRTVLEALLRESGRLGVELVAGTKVVSVEPLEGEFRLTTRRATPERPAGVEAVEPARRCVLATGGLSYPETGSDGTGLEIARRLGHRIVPTAPALTPLLSDDRDWAELAGVALEARLDAYASGRKRASSRGALLLAHFGFSGPAALDISRHWALTPPEDDPRVEADFLPELESPRALALVERERRRQPDRALKGTFVDCFALPQRFTETFLRKAQADPSSKTSRLPLAELRRIVARLKRYPLPVRGVYGYRKAEVTAGGVDLAQVRVGSMESKLVSGLYFAGEILDVDGRIGGFNFQWAWSTGTIAGTAAAGSLA